MKIAVTGATGHLGRLVIQKLAHPVATATKHEVIALARSPQKASDLGTAVREADYERPETLSSALSGVDVLVLISSSEVGKRVTQHENVINAAKAASVKRVIYTSILHADTSLISLAVEHRATEAQLRASGLPHTILRNGWYTENYDGAIAGALANGAFVGSAGEGKISGASRADYAAAAAVVAANEGHDGKTYELAGDDAFTMSELAAEVSRQTGKSLTYQDLPPAEYAKILSGMGLPPALAEAIAGWDAAVAKGAVFDDGRQLSRLIGRPTTPLADVVASALKKS